jgi:hypothetical protein
MATPLWQRKAGKNPEGGLNEAGRRSYNAKGGNLKPPVSKSQAKKSPASAKGDILCQWVKEHMVHKKVDHQMTKSFQENKRIYLKH